MFRCHGLDDSPSRADRLGLHDIAWWLIFVVAICAWFLLLFAPERQRLNNLVEREQMFRGHLKAEKRELARLKRSIDELAHNDPYAWERAARGRLGWVEPGELTDVVAYARTHNVRAPIPPAPQCPQTNAALNIRVKLPGAAAPITPLTPVGPLPKPRIPALPVPPPQLGKPKLVLAANSIDPEALGLVRGAPPPLPPPLPRCLIQNPKTKGACPIAVAYPNRPHTH